MEISESVLKWGESEVEKLRQFGACGNVGYCIRLIRATIHSRTDYLQRRAENPSMS